jgi:hypothetical protein
LQSLSIAHGELGEFDPEQVPGGAGCAQVSPLGR